MQFHRIDACQCPTRPNLYRYPTTIVRIILFIQTFLPVYTASCLLQHFVVSVSRLVGMIVVSRLCLDYHQIRSYGACQGPGNHHTNKTVFNCNYYWQACKRQGIRFVSIFMNKIHCRRQLLLIIISIIIFIIMNKLFTQSQKMFGQLLQLLVLF